MDLQSEQFQTLLGDALRSGPGSPEWHQAVRLLRSQGPGTDEYTLLISAREHLESGKEYRAVRAGPGFTRRLMDGLKDEKEGRDGRRGPFSANAVLLLSAGVILTVIVVVASVLMRGGAGDGAKTAADELEHAYFGKPLLAAAKFETPEAAEAKGEWKDWKRIGDLPLVVRNGLRLGPTAPAASASPSTSTSAPPSAPVPSSASSPAPAGISPAEETPHTGGIVTAQPIPAEQAISVNVTFRFSHGADKVGDLVAQIFITDEPADAKENGSHAIIWYLKAGEALVHVSGHTAPEGERSGGAEVHVRIRANRDAAIVDSDGKSLYRGMHDLAKDKPRYVGVRFLRRNGDKADGIALTSIGVDQP